MQFFRFYLKLFFRWFLSAPEETCPLIPFPPLKGDEFRSSTVLPYLEAYHYETDRELEDVYYTEHDLNGENFDLLTLY